MDTDTRCQEAKEFSKLDAAFRSGDLDARRAAADDPAQVPNGHTVFPPLVAALSGARPDVLEVIRLLLEFGADPNQRRMNDYPALHMAVAGNHLAAVQALLKAGADPGLRTRIDDYETPQELAPREPR